MKIKHALTKRTVEVPEHYAKSLLRAGHWEPAEAPEAPVVPGPDAPPPPKPKVGQKPSQRPKPPTK